ncbi:hypothetical protein KI387_003297, partial [Taxus chinensis]
CLWKVACYLTAVTTTRCGGVGAGSGGRPPCGCVCGDLAVDGAPSLGGGMSVG